VLAQPTQDSAPVSQFLEVRGIRTHLRERGSGPPLLMLHGAGGAGPWRPYLDRLAERFRVVFPDPAGFGASDEAPWIEAMDDVVYHYLDLLQMLGIAKAHVVGFSLGGWLAAELAVAHPEVVERLVLVDPAGLLQPMAKLPDLFMLSPDQHARLLFHDPQLGETAAAEAITTEAITQRVKNMAAFARLSWNPYLVNPKLARRLYRATMPTLVVWGREDRIIPVENAELWPRAIPHARLEIIEACGHTPQRERPDELVRLIADFLA
jgi:pimeloyl-ACP methyl ester carboxylesterase